jgi:antitoxin StbD
MNITNVSVSQLKSNPSAVLQDADDYPVAITNRSDISGYVVGKNLFEKLVNALEDLVDIKAAEESDTDDAVDFEDVAADLGI